jgi:lysostaphin
MTRFTTLLPSSLNSDVAGLRPYKFIGLTGAIAASAIALATPVEAMQVQVKPASPKLGDTLAVVVRLDNSESSAAPTVRFKDKTHPTFPIGGNRFRALLPTTPLDTAGSWQIQVSGEGKVEKLTVKVSNRRFPIQRINLPPGKSRNATETERQQVRAFKALVTPQKFWSGAFIAPNKGRRSTGFGVRRYYNGKFAKDYYHRGVDYAGGFGSLVVAPAAGRVALVGRESEGFRVHGNVVGVDHGQGVVSIFMHLSKIKVKEGDVVKPGQAIGAIGSTGASTGPHLHWGLYVQGESIDPASWLSAGWE